MMPQGTAGRKPEGRKQREKEMEGRKEKCQHLRSHSSWCSLLASLIENDSSLVTAVISVKDNTPHSMYVCIFLHQLMHACSQYLGRITLTDIVLFTESTCFHIWALLPFPVMNMYVSGWNLPQADHRESLTQTHLYHRDVY